MSQPTNSKSLDTQQLDVNAAAFRRRLLSWYQRRKRPLPWRLDWQDHADPYRIWVSEIMLQQTVIKAVIPAYKRFLEHFPSIHDLALAEEDEVRSASRGLGYYRRFRLMHRAAIQLVAEKSDCDPFWPQSYQEWLTLPGIGNYTAAALASITNDEAVCVVDGNVERVFCRLLDLRVQPNQGPLKKAFFELGNRLISNRKPGDFNQALMELGQTVCLKQNPDCPQCPVQQYCLAFTRNSQDKAPQTKQRTAPTEIRGQLLIARRQGKIGLLKRPTNAKFLRDTLGFPTTLQGPSEVYEWDGDVPAIKGFARTETIGEIKHSITRYRLRMAVQVVTPSARDAHYFQWFQPQEIEPHLVANLDRKAWHLLDTPLMRSL
jgi:A/G-specific adenine glycosylase